MNNYWEVLVALAFFWTGFVGAISFMEAWLKFRAPGVDTPTGLSIGRLVFKALNKVEWVMALALVGLILMNGGLYQLYDFILLIPVIVLILQTVWLLPALNRRVDMALRKEPLPSSGIHIYYVAGELLKVASLLFAGIKLLYG